MNEGTSLSGDGGNQDGVKPENSSECPEVEIFEVLQRDDVAGDVEDTPDLICCAHADIDLVACQLVSGGTLFCTVNGLRNLGA